MQPRSVRLRCFWFSLALALAIGSFTAVADAKQGIVKTRDGRSFQGDITEAGNGDVSINVRGVVINLTPDNVDLIEYPENFDAEYQKRLDALAGDNVNGRLELARWAFEHEQYERAREAAQSALDIDPNSADAVTLLETIRVQMRLEQNRQNQPTAEQGADQLPADGEIPSDLASPHGEGEIPAHYRIERKLLRAADVNRIRQLELQSSDNAVRVRFANDVERRFASATNQDPGRFRNLRPIQKAIEILNDGDDNFVADVHVLNDPASLMEFRRFVQPLVLNGCATTGCHGGSVGASLVLFSPADSDEVTYTNFYILQQYRKPAAQGQGGVFGTGDRRMIDRTKPQDSLLLQYGLPADVAQFDHPPVRGLKPIFRSQQDPRYQQVVRWMTESLKPIDPDYGINYQLPTGPADAPQPAATTGPVEEPSIPTAPTDQTPAAE